MAIDLHTNYPLQLLELSPEQRDMFRDYWLTGQVEPVLDLHSTVPMVSLDFRSARPAREFYRQYLGSAGWEQLSFPWA